MSSPIFEEPHGASEQAAIPFAPAPLGPPTAMDAVLERSRQRLLTIQGVVGVGQGRTAIGDDAILAFVDNQGVGSKVPRELEGYPVEVIVVPGGFHAQSR